MQTSILTISPIVCSHDNDVLISCKSATIVSLLTWTYMRIAQILVTQQLTSIAKLQGTSINPKHHGSSITTRRA